MSPAQAALLDQTQMGLVVLGSLWACGRPDGQALKKLACEQAINNIDLESETQLDCLRKALGLASGVDPIGACRAHNPTSAALI